MVSLERRERHTHTHTSTFSADGYQFFQSANDVILCPGNKQGVLPSDYFSKVIELPSGRSHDHRMTVT